MALRNTNVVLGTLIRAGMICLAASGRTCVAHGLPSTPDSVLFSPTLGVLGCYAGAFLESWDATSLVFVNSYGAPAALNLRAAVEYSAIQ